MASRGIYTCGVHTHKHTLAHTEIKLKEKIFLKVCLRLVVSIYRKGIFFKVIELGNSLIQEICSLNV